MIMKEENILYVGVDVGSKVNVASFLDRRDKEVIPPWQFANNQTGAEELEEKIIKLCSEKGFSPVRIGTEATSFYDFHLADFLAESKELNKFKIEVYRFNPRIIHHFKKILKDLEKTDFIDALVIAKRLKFGNLPCPYHCLKDYLPLQRLTRYRYHLIKEIVREKGFLLTHLFLKNSELATKRPIKRVLGSTSRAIIHKYLSKDEIAKASLEELTELITKASKNRYQDPQVIAKLVKQTSRESYRIREGLANSLNLVIVSCFRSIRSYQQSLKEINKAIEDQLKGFGQTLTSVPGIGSILAAGIIAEIGDVKRFHSADALAKYAGLWWPRKQSGEFEAEERRLNKSGNKYLRYYLVEAASSMRVHNEEYRRFYQKKYQEAVSHHHKRALVLTARKLVRLVFSLLKTKQLYQKEKQQ
ncbi:MAG TPA: IS110 family transposase [Thermoplasmata archaeon]|nr:IS110 family transposase [Thermoplasmata archaeon]